MVQVKVRVKTAEKLPFVSNHNAYYHEQTNFFIFSSILFSNVTMIYLSKFPMKLNKS